MQGLGLDSFLKWVGHVRKSLMFKPAISLVIDPCALSSQEEYNMWEDQCRLNGEDKYLNLHVVSDGRRAFVKRI